MRRPALHLLYLIILLGILVKATIPAGFMPGEKNGMVAMVICSGADEATIFVPAGDVPGEDGAPHDLKICDYLIAASHKAIEAPPEIFIPAPAPLLTLETAAPVDRVIAAQLTLSFARGPPALV